MISADLLGCSTARNKGTCDNRLNIRRDRLKGRVLSALRHHLVDLELFKEFCSEFTREMNRLHSKGRSLIDGSRAEMKRIERELDISSFLFASQVLETIKAKAMPTSPQIASCPEAAVSSQSGTTIFNELAGSIERSICPGTG